MKKRKRRKKTYLGLFFRPQPPLASRKSRTIRKSPTQDPRRVKREVALTLAISVSRIVASFRSNTSPKLSTRKFEPRGLLSYAGCSTGWREFVAGDWLKSGLGPGMLCVRRVPRLQRLQRDVSEYNKERVRQRRERGQRIKGSKRTTYET